MLLPVVLHGLGTCSFTVRSEKTNNNSVVAKIQNFLKYEESVRK